MTQAQIDYATVQGWRDGAVAACAPRQVAFYDRLLAALLYRWPNASGTPA